MCHKMHMQNNSMYVKQTSAHKLDNEITNNIAHYRNTLHLLRNIDKLINIFIPSFPYISIIN